jgi:hypothetical protein
MISATYKCVKCGKYFCAHHHEYIKQAAKELAGIFPVFMLEGGCYACDQKLFRSITHRILDSPFRIANELLASQQTAYTDLEIQYLHMAKNGLVFNPQAENVAADDPTQRLLPLHVRAAGRKRSATTMTEASVQELNNQRQKSMRFSALHGQLQYSQAQAEDPVSIDEQILLCKSKKRKSAATIKSIDLTKYEWIRDCGYVSMRQFHDEWIAIYREGSLPEDEGAFARHDTLMSHPNIDTNDKFPPWEKIDRWVDHITVFFQERQGKVDSILQTMEAEFGDQLPHFMSIANTPTNQVTNVANTVTPLALTEQDSPQVIIGPVTPPPQAALADAPAVPPFPDILTFGIRVPSGRTVDRIMVVIICYLFFMFQFS